MELSKSILESVRESVGLTSDTTGFDSELLQHINSAIGTLNQNGIGNFLVVNGVEETWQELQNPEQVEGNKFFQQIPLFITLSTKILFDPPPPSNVLYYSQRIQEILWRLKVAYEDPYVPPEPTSDE